MNNIILYHLGLYFFEQFTFTPGKSSEALYQESKRFRFFRNLYTIIFPLFGLIALYEHMFVAALACSVVVLITQSNSYWLITGVGIANGKCILAWQRVRKEVQKTSAFKMLEVELECTPIQHKIGTLKKSRHYVNCLEAIRPHRRTTAPLYLPLTALKTQ